MLSKLGRTKNQIFNNLTKIIETGLISQILIETNSHIKQIILDL